MEFERFERSFRLAYEESSGMLFTLSDALRIFECFFQWYKIATGEDHPPIRREQIKAIIEKMPSTMDAQGREIPFIPEDYTYMIARYFETEYLNCDYRINHFFSGNVRAVKFYEACY